MSLIRLWERKQSRRFGRGIPDSQEDAKTRLKYLNSSCENAKKIQSNRELEISVPPLDG